jgi:hypothetical protein
MPKGARSSRLQAATDGVGQSTIRVWWSYQAGSAEWVDTSSSVTSPLATSTISRNSPFA